MKRNIYILIGVAAIIVIVGALVFCDFRKPNSNKAGFTQGKIQNQAVLIINDGQSQPQTFKVIFFEGATALDLLKSETDRAGLALKTKVYDVGTMVQAIASKENGQDGKYWLYYVNGKMPVVSADKQKVNLGDQVEFKFEKSSY